MPSFRSGGRCGGSRSASTTSFTPALTAMGGWIAAGALWTVFLDLLKQQNLGRVLAEPNLVNTSGRRGGDGEIPQNVYTRKRPNQDRIKEKNGLNRTRRITRETEACILTS